MQVGAVERILKLLPALSSAMPDALDDALDQLYLDQRDPEIAEQSAIGQTSL